VKTIKVENEEQCDQIGRFIGLGQLSKPLTTIILPKSPTFLGNFCKGVKISNFSREIIFGRLLQTLGDFLLVTLAEEVEEAGSIEVIEKGKKCNLKHSRRIKVSAKECEDDNNNKIERIFDQTFSTEHCQRGNLIFRS